MTRSLATTLLVCSMLAAVPVVVAPVIAQELSGVRAGRPVRLVLASTKLPSVVESPLHFKLVRVTVPAGQSTTFSGPNSMVYPLSGSLSLSLDSERRALADGEGAFVPAGQRATLAAGRGGAAVFLHHLLVPAPDVATTFHSPPATVAELYRTAESIPGLKAGPYEFTLTRVTAQPKIPAPPMHQRSGAALYYVLGGNWTIHLPDRREARARGVVQYEPNGFVHTWENTGDGPGGILQANISPEGAPEIIFLQRPGQ